MVQQIMAVMGGLAVLSLIGVVSMGVFKIIMEAFSNKNLWLSFNLYLEGWTVKVHPLLLETWFGLESYLYLGYKFKKMEHNKFNEEDLNDLKTVLTEIRDVRMMLEDHLERSRANKKHYDSELWSCKNRCYI